MKTKLLSIIMSFCCSFVFAQTTITLQPDATLGKDALLHGEPNEVNVNYGTNVQLAADAWTFSGNPGVVRSILEFDLSSIPASATVLSAYLSLYAIDASAGLGQHSTLSGPNDCWLNRVTSAWNESTVTWNTQPTYTTLNQVALAASTSPTQDYLNTNVTALVQDMVNNPSSSFGFMLMLQNEQQYRCMNFCSSDHTTATSRPKLVITYDVYTITCLTIKIEAGAGGGQDASVHGAPSEVNVPYGTVTQLAADAWTFSGNPGVIRSLIEFDLSSVPSNAVIDSALLSLYAIDFTNGWGQHSQLSGSNAGWLQRITSSWIQATVTWNSQPTSTTVNQVAVPASISPTQDYLNMDVQPLVVDIINNPSTSFGFMLRLQTEQQYRCLNFCSSEHSNALKHPQLKVCYHVLAGVENRSEQNNSLIVFPNPATSELRIENSELKIEKVEIYNLPGEKTFGQQLTANSQKQIVIDVSSLAPGIYFVKVKGEKESRVAKFVKQ